jgi:hypothetical protein
LCIGHVAIAVASSGISILLLEGGRTAHLNVEIFNFLFFFPPSDKKILKENIEHSRNFYLVEMIFQITYLFI